MSDSPLLVEIAPGGEPADPATWEWVDVTDRAVEPVVIIRGRSSESDTAGPVNVSLTLRNDDGALSPRNPLGPWYGRLGLNTPLRVSWSATERATVFLSELPTTWPGVVEVSRVPVRGDGLFRRLGQGSDALNSALHRYFANHDDVIAYWPGEDEGASVSSPIRGVRPITPSGVEFANADGPDGSDRLLTAAVGTTGLSGQVPSHPASEAYSVFLVWRMDEAPTAGRAMMTVYSSSSGLARWRVTISDTTFQITAVDSDESSVVSSTESSNIDDVIGRDVYVLLVLEQNGSDVDWSVQVRSADADATVLQSLSGKATSRTLGRVAAAGLSSRGGKVFQDRVVGHIAVLRSAVIAADLDAVHGHTGETAAARFERLCEEENLRCSVVGTAADTMPMGPQWPDTLLGLFREIEATDGGVLGDGGELVYRTRADRYNQAPVVELGERDVLSSPESTDDDRHIRNDVTASGRQGSSARVVDGGSVRRFGRYSPSVNVNPAGDSLLAQIAAWHVHLGTTEEMRWPRIPVSVLKNPALVAEWLALKVGDRLTAHNCFPQLPGMDIDVLVEGWTETLRTENVRLDLNCSPARPWNVFEVAHATFGRLWSPRAYLGEDINASATSFDVVVPVQRAWNLDSGFEDPRIEIENNFGGITTVWATNGGILERSSAVVFTGRRSGKFTPDGVSSSPDVRSGRMRLSAPGATVRGSAWVMAPAALTQNVRLRLSWLVTAVTSTSVSLTPGVWTRLVLTTTAPAAAATQPVTVFVEFVGTPAATDVIYIDDQEMGRPDAPFEVDTGLSTPIIIGGERMTVTAIGADDGTGAQTFTVTRSVNSVSKSHAAGAPVRLWPGHVMGL